MKYKSSKVIFLKIQKKKNVRMMRTTTKQTLEILET